MSLLGLRNIKRWQCLYAGIHGDCDTCDEYLNCSIGHRSSTDFKPLTVDLPPPPEPDINCCQKCASCWKVPCDSLKEHFQFAKEIPAALSFADICKAEDRAADNFHNCISCRDILSCKILKRAMT